MMASRSTKSKSSRKPAAKSSARTTAKKSASSTKKSGAKKSTFQKLLTAEGWKRLMMGKSSKKSK